MKRITALLLALVMVLSLAACAKQAEPSTYFSTPPIKVDPDQNQDNKDNEKEPLKSDAVFESSVDEVITNVQKDIEDTISALILKKETLEGKIDTYKKYKENISEIETFYTEIYDETKHLCIRLREYSLACAEAILASDISNDDKYDDLEIIYDDIYDDAGDDVYDEIYDGILDDMYDTFYDGVLDDAYDEAPYDEWSDFRSDEYDWWSDTRSDVYDEWSDFRSDVYDFWSDMRSKLWRDDMEKVEKVISDFQEDILKLGGNIEYDSTNNKAIPEDKTKPGSSSEELIDGMRPEFKEAMDSYEAFYDEYCDLMEQYKEDPTNTQLLTKYTDMLSKAIEMNEAFDTWDQSELNKAELKYYLEVQNRVMQKIVDVAG